MLSEDKKKGKRVEKKDKKGVVLEFYCGIGGLHYAYDMAHESLPLSHPLASVKEVVPFDINPSATVIYEHNFKGDKVDRVCCP